MKISEYTLLELAFERSFGFMLTRIEETSAGALSHFPEAVDRETAQDRCFTEFIIALEELGVELETGVATKDEETV